LSTLVEKSFVGVGLDKAKDALKKYPLSACYAYLSFRNFS
jgi:hypothetical protein